MILHQSVLRPTSDLLRDLDNRHMDFSVCVQTGVDNALYGGGGSEPLAEIDLFLAGTAILGHLLTTFVKPLRSTGLTHERGVRRGMVSLRAGRGCNLLIG